MSTGPFAVNLSEARRYRGWFIALGAVLLVLGIAALGSPVVVTLVSVVVYGVLIGAAGIGEIVTLLIGILFLAGGAVRLAFSVGMQYPNWGWGALSGVISMLLGGMILANWPYDGLLLIGTFIGIELLFRGFTWLMLGISLGTAPAEPNTPRTA
jgi:uncharacterized membrane protein HdeD (DUF308 family)